MRVHNDKPDMADRASAARASAGLDDDAAPNTETRGVDNASDMNDGFNDDADPGVVPNVEDEKTSRINL